MRNGWWHVGLIAALSGAPTPAAAQAGASEAPATLTYIEGDVDLDQEGVAERADAPTLLAEGDRLRTLNGRAELILGDGSSVHADQGTTVEWMGGTRLRLLDGRVAIRVSALTASIVIDTAQGSARLDRRGEYDVRFDQQRGDLELSVSRGFAELSTSAERISIRPGESGMVDTAERVTLRPFNSARFDAFGRWSYDRTYSATSAAASAWLPHELRTYGPLLERHGRWDYAPSHGYVWYPSVGSDWRPYSFGHWRYTRRGWTWYGADAWSLPTHHYGRWGLSGASWFWIPGTGWGPGWVSWGFGSGLVSWCPLGWDGRPVIDFWARGRYQAYDPWRAWTAVPRDRFGHRGPLHSWRVDGRHLSEPVRRSFVLQDTPPPGPGDRAIPRGTLSVAAGQASTGAIPRTDERAAGPSWERRPRPAEGAEPHALPTRPPAGGVRRPESMTPGSQSTTPYEGRSTTPTIVGPRAVTPPPGDDARGVSPRRRAPWPEDRTGGSVSDRPAEQPSPAPSQSWSAPRIRVPDRRDAARADAPRRSTTPAGERERAVPSGSVRSPERARGGMSGPPSETGGGSQGNPGATPSAPSTPGSPSDRAVRRPSR